ncbi:MAG: SdpI family protein, partial [Candidatus Diapherotrites archaeon]|nr:SdpI family protein [Candidatus Diapherotrites archaeon]
MKALMYIALALLIFMFVLSAYYYPQMPEKVPSHWNAKGEINGYLDPFWGLFLVPIMTLFVFGIFLIIPKIAVFKENIIAFLKYYYGIVLILTIFLLSLQLSIIYAALGNPLQINYVIMPGISILFIYIGYTMQFVKRNYFVGIRTPWTLSSDEVWDKT